MPPEYGDEAGAQMNQQLMHGWMDAWEREQENKRRKQTLVIVDDFYRWNYRPQHHNARVRKILFV